MNAIQCQSCALPADEIKCCRDIPFLTGEVLFSAIAVYNLVTDFDGWVWKISTIALGVFAVAHLGVRRYGDPNTAASRLDAAARTTERTTHAIEMIGDDIERNLGSLNQTTKSVKETALLLNNEGKEEISALKVTQEKLDLTEKLLSEEKEEKENLIKQLKQNSNQTNQIAKDLEKANKQSQTLTQQVTLLTKEVDELTKALQEKGTISRSKASAFETKSKKNLEEIQRKTDSLFNNGGAGI